MDHGRELPLFELAYPGPLRDRLVDAVLSGAKTSTSSLLVEYAPPEDPLPVVGQRYLMVDSGGRGVGVVETTEVRTLPLGEVDLAFAREEGEGYESVEAWRTAHERYWRRTVPEVDLVDDTVVVAERFRLVERLGIRIEGLVFVGTRTPARAEMADFLGRVLGLPQVDAGGMDAELFRLPDGSTFAVTSPDGPAERTMGLRVDDVEQAAAALRAARVEVDDEVSESATQRYLHLRAPDGKLYELVEERRH